MTQEFVTLPREVVEQALEALREAQVLMERFQDEKLRRSAMQALCAALEQPQAEQPAMTPIAQRKLDSLLAEGYTISGYSIYHEQKHQHGFVTGAGLVGWWKPEGVEYPQPQGEQEPVAWLTIEVMGPRTKVDVEWEDQLQKLPSGIYKLYTNPQPKREPLTDEEIDKLCPQFDDPMRREMWIIGFKAAHNIK